MPVISALGIKNKGLESVMKYIDTIILRICILGVLFSATACSPSIGIHEYFGVRQNNEPLETYQADEFPAIKWDGSGIITAGQLDSALNAKNTATFGVREYLTGGKYKYFDEFTELYKGDVLIHRIFQYRDHESWLFRAVDQDGNRFENYILVTSSPRKNGGCHHTIMRKGNTFESVYKYVEKKPDTVIEKSQQPAPNENSGCK